MWCKGGIFSFFYFFFGFFFFAILVPRGINQESKPLTPDPIFWACAEYLFHILSQSDLSDLMKCVNRGLPVLDQPRGHNSWCWPKRSAASRDENGFFFFCMFHLRILHNERQFTLRLKEQWKQWEMACSGQDQKHPSSSLIYNSHEAKRKTKKVETTYKVLRKYN